MRPGAQRRAFVVLSARCAVKTRRSLFEARGAFSPTRRTPGRDGRNRALHRGRTSDRLPAARVARPNTVRFIQHYTTRPGDALRIEVPGSVSKKRSSAPKSTNVVAQARKGKAPRAGGKNRVWENVKSILGAVLVYLVIKTFLIEAYRIPSGSMIPTLLVGDWLFVNKLVYGPTIPFTNVHLPGYSDPKRNDVVVFVSPTQTDQPNDPNPTLVKRLIGMPGDTLYMRGAQLYLNGIPQRQGFDASKNPKAASDEVNDLFAWQHQHEVHGSRFGEPPQTPSHDNWGPILIPRNFYFMMGDNRYCSKDSRYWGIVPKANVRGRPVFVYYSFRPNSGASDPCNGETSDRPLSFITDIRWGRIGHVIH